MPRSEKLLWPFELNRSSPQSVGLVGWYPGGPSGGRKIFDMSVRRKTHLTLNSFGFTNASGWCPGVDGGQGALLLDGTDDYASGGTTATTYPLSMTAWFRLTTVPAGGNTEKVICALANPAAVDEFWISAYRETNVNYIRCVAQSNSGGNEREFRVTTPLDLKWHLVGATFTSTTVQAVYIDGNLQTGGYVTAGAGTPNPSGVNSSYIGSFLYNTSNLYAPFGGAIEDFRVYNRVLSASDMAAMYNPATRWQLRQRSKPSLLQQITASPPPVGTTLFGRQAVNAASTY